MNIKTTELTTNDYVLAAKVVASCKNERLPLVLEVLKYSGIELSYDAVKEAAGPDVADKVSTKLSMKEERERHYKDRWFPTDDPVVLTLRRAYIDGYKISDISSAAGITRTALYEYMKGRRKYSDFIRTRFETAFATLGIPYPPTSSTSYIAE